MNRRAATALFVAVGLLGSVATPGAQRGESTDPAISPQHVTAEHVRAIDGWVAAIEQHSPGELDGSVVMLEGLSADQVKTLRQVLPHFVAYLQNRLERVPSSPAGPLKNVAESAKKAAATYGWLPFMKRAMLLHVDAGVARLTTKDAPPSPNVVDTPELILTRDGQVVGRASGDWNWLVGRQLADLVLKMPRSSDPWVSNWYHTVSATLLATRQYGELKAHFAKSEVVLANDALALFDRACAAEANGLPATQQVRDTGIAGAFNRQRLSIDAVVATQTSSNAEAERLLRRALEVDPNMVEARVRLARLLGVRNKPEESVRESETALASLAKSPDDDRRLEFYAHLFASRSNRTLGHVTAALPHVDAALALFPEAQSALLEQSGVALTLADTAGAIAPVDRLSSVVDPITNDTDPWWAYQLGSGRNAPTIVEQLRSAIR